MRDDIYRNINQKHIGEYKKSLTYMQVKNADFSKEFTTAFSTITVNDKSCQTLNEPLAVSISEYKLDQPLRITVIDSQGIHRAQYVDKFILPHIISFVQLTYILSGELHTIIEKKEYSFSQGEAYLISTNLMHTELLDTDAIVINISFKKEVFDEILLADINDSTLNGFLRRCIHDEHNIYRFLHFSPDESQETSLSDYISKILLEAQSRQRGYLYICKGYLVRILDLLIAQYRFTFVGDMQKKYNEYLFQEVEKYMLEHFSDIKLKDLSNRFHYQENYFNLLIQKHTGLSYSDYLIRIRVNQAKYLLETTRLSIDEIMVLVGYQNKGFFYRVFKKETGMKPAAYRKMKIKEQNQ